MTMRSHLSLRVAAACSTPDGCTSAELRAILTDVSPATLSVRLHNMVIWGHLRHVGPKGHYRYFADWAHATAWAAAHAAELAALEAELNRPPSQRKRLALDRANERERAQRRREREAKLALAPTIVHPAAPVTIATTSRARFAEAEAVVPDGVKRTYAPAPPDYRFHVDPSIAGRGAITQDWRERRLREMEDR